MPVNIDPGVGGGQPQKNWWETTPGYQPWQTASWLPGQEPSIFTPYVRGAPEHIAAQYQPQPQWSPQHEARRLMQQPGAPARGPAGGWFKAPQQWAQEQASRGTYNWYVPGRSPYTPAVGGAAQWWNKRGPEPGGIEGYAERRAQAGKGGPNELQYESAQAFQQQIFSDYGFTPEAQQILGTIPFTVTDLTTVGQGGGGYYSDQRRVDLLTVQREAAIHELAHAWSEETGLIPQGSSVATDPEFRRAIQRLAAEADPAYRRAAELARGYEEGIDDWSGMGENDAERFAGLASGVMGDVSKLPPYIRKFYAGLFSGQGIFQPQGVLPWQQNLGPAGGWFKEPQQWAQEQGQPAGLRWGPEEQRAAFQIPEEYREQPSLLGRIKREVGRITRPGPPTEAPLTPEVRREAEAWRGAEAAQQAFMAGVGPELTPEQLAALEVGPPTGLTAQAAKRDVAATVKGVAAVWGIVPEPVRVPAEKVAGGVLGFFGKFADVTKRGLSIANFELMKRTSPEFGITMPWATEESMETRRNIFALTREINVTPEQANQLGTSHWTWVGDPSKLEQALEEVKAGADPLEVAEKHRNDAAEIVGELVIDPLFFAPLLTKPLSKLISGAAQGVKKFPLIAPLFELSKRSVVQVAKFDTVDIGKVIFKSGDDAKTMAKTLDSFLDDATKFADDLRPRGQQQAESITKLIKGSGLSGKKIIKKGMSRSDAVEAFAQATSQATAKAIGYAPSSGRTLVQGAQQILVEHWLGTRPAWLVYNYADNTLKLGIEGVGPWFRLGPNLEKHIAAYGDVPAQISAGFSKAITRGDDISMHEKVLGLPGKPVTAIMNKGGRMEGTARTRLFIHNHLGLARGGRDDALRLADDMLGPVDDGIRGLIKRDVRAESWPNEDNVYEAIMRYLKKKRPVTSPRSFVDDAGRIPDEPRQAVIKGLEKARTPEEVAAVFDAADVRTVEEATEYMKRMGQPGDWTPYTSFDDVGGPSAVFEEGGDQLIGFRPDLNHEIVGELAGKHVKINPKHAQRAVDKIHESLGLPKGTKWAAAKKETGGESSRLWYNYLLDQAFENNIELPSWFERIELVEPAEDIAWVTQKLAAAQEAGDAERVAALERQLYMATQRAEAAPPAARAAAEAAEALRPFQMTKAEWEASGQVSIFPHETMVKRALAKGEDVPANVLADYPDLAAPGVAERLAREETGAWQPGEMANRISQPILDEFAKWRMSATDDLARAGETIEQSPEAMKAIRNYAKAAKKIMRATLDDAPVKASLKVNKTLGNYTERNKLSEMMRDIITFWDWPAYNIPYWGRTFMEKPMVPATFAKARAFTAAVNDGLPDRFKYTIELPLPPGIKEKMGWGPEDEFRVDPYRYASFMQQMPGGTPWQASKLKEAMDDPTSPESIWAIGSQMGLRTWPWNETVLGAAGLLGDDWYPFDLSSYESIARAVFDTDMTPSSWWREKMGLEPNKFLEWQTQKEVRAQIIRGEPEDWEAAREKARNKGGFLALMAILGVPTKVYTAQEAERMGMTAELREALHTDVTRTGGDPAAMTTQEAWDWAKRHGATMKDRPSAINTFYEKNPEYAELPWEGEDEYETKQQTTNYYDDMRKARENKDARLADLPIPQPYEAKSLIYDDYDAEVAAIKDKYPLANTTPSYVRPMEVLRDKTASALLYQLDETQPWYDQEKYDNYNDYMADLQEWQKGLRDRAIELWGPEVFKDFQHLASVEAVDEYNKSKHNMYRAADYTWRKHIQSPFWDEAQQAQVSALSGAADWVNVKEPISQWSEDIERAAADNDIDPRIIAAIIELESNGNPEAYNSKSQATGLMQVMPEEVFEGRPSSDELLDPGTNIETGTAILKDYLDGAGWDLKDALYQYSGGSAWSSRESFETKYWDRLSAKFKGLWGVSLGELRAEARDEVMGRPGDVDVETLIPLIMLEYPDRWTPDEIRAELGGQTIQGVLEAQAMQKPEEAKARAASDEFWDMYNGEMPPGVYRNAVSDLPDVKSFMATGENPKAALEAIEVYMDEHPTTGDAQEWAQAEREHDEFRRYAYNEWGQSIYEEQNAYYAAREEGRRVEPSERLQAYWDAHTQFRQEHPVYTQYYFPGWEPFEGGTGTARAKGGGYTRKPTQQQVLQDTATAWKDFAAAFTDGAALLELLQSYLLLPPSQRANFLRSNPELGAWLEGKDATWLGELAQSLGAHLALTEGRRGQKYMRRAWQPRPRYYKQWS